ncbi:MAG: transposase, partial [Prosthecobacter sp.]|nr:transposase [Prosthecobacter sp.]
PKDEIDKSYRRLPHWEQPDVCYFLTFRTIDSIPAEVMNGWKSEREQWLRANGIDPETEDWHSLLEMLPQEVRDGFHERFSKRMHEFLDTNVGECLLRRPDLREIVVEALGHFDADRYQLAGFVIMPNHVHVLVQCLGENRIKAVCYSWKRYTARLIHERLERKGHFWQAETYDHIVRSEAQFEHYRNYIRENPSKGKLREREYALYLPELE